MTTEAPAPAKKAAKKAAGTPRPKTAAKFAGTLDLTEWAEEDDLASAGSLRSPIEPLKEQYLAAINSDDPDTSIGLLDNGTYPFIKIGEYDNAQAAKDARARFQRKHEGWDFRVKVEGNGAKLYMRRATPAGPA